MELTAKTYDQHYGHLALTELAKALKEHYYDTIAVLCKDADDILDEVSVKHEDSISATYRGFCKGIIDKLKELAAQRVDVLMPYLYVLNKKNEEHHDCSTCGTNCGIEHKAHLLALRVSAQEARTLIKVFMEECQPFAANGDLEANYNALEKQMQMLIAAADRLFYLEEIYLIPKIKGVQKNIHVRS